MQISTRGLVLVLVLGALFLLSFGLVIVKEAVTKHGDQVRVSFRTPSGEVSSASAELALPNIGSLFGKPKSTGLVPPPPAIPAPELSGWSNIKLND